jgi:hypothetical protein
MKPRYLLAAILGLGFFGTAEIAMAQGTAFTYQGELSDANGPLNGLYDLTFTLFDGASPGANQVGSPQALSSVQVSAGLFTTMLDFQSGVFTGPARWLQIAVHPHSGGLTNTLSPRQLLTPAPYAIFAGSVSNGAVSASQLFTP